MMSERVRKIADSILYEGYLLYPYRASNVKNRRRWTFGGLYPESYAPRTGDRSGFQAQVLLRSFSKPEIEATVRFLHLVEEKDNDQTWQTAIARQIVASNETSVQSFCFPARQWIENNTVRRQAQVEGIIEMTTEPLLQDVQKLTLRVVNLTQIHDSGETSRDQASLYALVSAHAIIRVSGGKFVSMTNPPAPLGAAAELCKQEGVWPVLAGEEGSSDCILVSPIILEDYPRVAPESPGDLFDGAEIDEILTLRILTMTDGEKEEMRRLDNRSRRLLERTEQLSQEQLMRLHGTLRNPRMFDS